MKKTALINLPFSDEQKQKIINAAPDITFRFLGYKEVTPQDVAQVQIIFGFVWPDIIQYAEKLEWYQLGSSGADKFLQPGVLKESVIITTATGAYGEEITEYLFGLLLSIYKNLHIYRDRQWRQQWGRVGPPKSIKNSTVLIIGAGDIGTEFAKKLKLFGAYTIGVRRSEKPKSEWLDEQYTPDHLDELIPRADVITLCLPNTADTLHIIDQKRLALFKKDAILINVGRGSTVDTEALCDALEEHRIGGACLDVMDPEPLPPGHRLWSIEDAIITSHAAGQNTLPIITEKSLEFFLSNLGAFRRGEQLKNVIDKSLGYCKKDI